MPATSQAQRAWAFGNKGGAWARKHHFDTKGKLPRYAPKHKGKAKTRDDVTREQLMAKFAAKHRGKRHG